MANRRAPDGLAYVVWEITLRCDLSCGHCGSRAGKARGDELSTEEALDVVRQLGEMGVGEISIIGGEAYLRADWSTIARAIKAAGMSCTMTTGGRSLDAEKARAMAEAGIDAISVSIDGMAAAHDRQRNVVGSFAAARAALGHLRDAGVYTSVNTQINRLSFPDLDAVLDLIAAEGARAWQVQLTGPIGRAADRPEWLLQPYDLLEVMPKIAELSQRARSLGIRLWPGNNVGYFGPHEADLQRGAVDGAHTSGCGAGKYVLGIESDGAIKGCPSLPTASYTGGHVRDLSIQRIWEETRELRFARDRVQGEIDELWGFCRSCYYAEVCRAGCTWTGHTLMGRRGNNPYCHHRALEHDKQGLRERLVLAEAAPGLPFDHGRFDLVVEPAPPPVPLAAITVGKVGKTSAKKRLRVM